MSEAKLGYDPKCPKCDEGWVCENHADKAWPSVCDCGPGMPCTCSSMHNDNIAIKQRAETLNLLLTMHDYVSDVANGESICLYETKAMNARIQKTACEDLDRLDAAIALLRAAS